MLGAESRDFMTSFLPPGVDPDLLVFGKYFTPNLRVLPHHYSRVNASEPLPPDKRQFVHAPPPATLSLPSTPASPDVTGGSVATSTLPLQTTTRRPTNTATPSSSSGPQQPSEGYATMTPTTSTPAPASSSTAPPLSRAGTTVKNPSASAALSPTPPTSLQPPKAPESSERSPNDTEGSVATNHTSGGEGGQAEEDSEGGLGPGWPVAAHTLTVVVAVGIVVLLCCCCPFLSLVSWRGRRKRTGHYRAPQGGRRGSMRLIKYVVVRENAKL